MEDILVEIIDILENYRDECSSRVSYYYNECTSCMSGSCKKCAESDQNEIERCNKIINILNDYLNP